MSDSTDRYNEDSPPVCAGLIVIEGYLYDRLIRERPVTLEIGEYLLTNIKWSAPPSPSDCC